MMVGNEIIVDPLGSNKFLLFFFLSEGRVAGSLAESN